MTTTGSSSDGLRATLENSIQALGRGFDVTSDIRLLYCKGAPGSRLIAVDEGGVGDLEVSDGVVLSNVPVDVRCSKGVGGIERTGVCGFHEVSS